MPCMHQMRCINVDAERVGLRKGEIKEFVPKSCANESDELQRSLVVLETLQQ